MRGNGHVYFLLVSFMRSFASRILFFFCFVLVSLSLFCYWFVDSFGLRFSLFAVFFFVFITHTLILTRRIPFSLLVLAANCKWPPSVATPHPSPRIFIMREAEPKHWPTAHGTTTTTTITATAVAPASAAPAPLAAATPAPAATTTTTTARRAPPTANSI